MGNQLFQCVVGQAGKLPAERLCLGAERRLLAFAHAVEEIAAAFCQTVRQLLIQSACWVFRRHAWQQLLQGLLIHLLDDDIAQVT